MDIPKFVHPPRDLPKLPLMEDLELDRADLDLVPVPKVELAWESGPEPEPAYSSIATTPFLLSRSGSPTRSMASSRPASALPSRPASALPRSPSPVGTLTPQEPSRAPTPTRMSLRGGGIRASYQLPINKGITVATFRSPWPHLLCR